MAFHTGKFRILGVNMDEIVAFGIDLIHRFAAALGQNQMTRLAIARFDRLLPIGRDVFAVVTTKTTVPVLVADIIRMASLVGLYFWKEILAING